MRFFFLLGLGEESGVAVGEDFFFFFADDEALGSGVSEGVGVAVAFFFGEADFSGVALGFGVGDFSAVDFFFFRGVGVGVGAKIFFSLLPNVSSAGARTANAPIDATTQKATAMWIVRRIDAPARRYFFPSSASTALLSRMPPSRFSSGKFSLGE